MKNKKGFTLVELLGVLVVLTVILMIAYPLITSYVNNTKQKSYNTQMEILLTNLRDYASDYEPILPKMDGEYVIITLGQLKSAGVINNNVINPLDGKVIEDSMEFKILKQGNNYIYEIVENSIKTRKNSYDSPIIELTGSPLEYYDVGDTYVEKGYKGYDYNGNEITVSATNNVNMSSNGIYNVKYSVTDSNGVSSYVYRTIIVGSGYETIIYEKYEDGQIVYFNPTTGTTCSSTNAVSTTGTKDGCMKWYAFLDDESNSTVNLLLDHNTTATVAWNNDANGTTPDTVNAKLQEDVTNWNDAVKSTARLIRALEVSRLVPKNGIWIENDDSTWYYFQDGSQTIYKGDARSNKYAWLFDNTNNCTKYGCNIGVAEEIYGYWTANYAASGLTWVVRNFGSLSYKDVSNSLTYGVRPVITVNKSVLSNAVEEKTYTITLVSNDGNPNTTKLLTYGARYGELPTLSREGYVFDGWALSNGIKIEPDSVVMYKINHNIYAQWKKIYKKYNDGYELLYDPVNNVACSTSIGSTTGTKDGCMKWHVFLDDKYNEKVKLLLDHNTGGYVAWNSSATGTTPDRVNGQLQSVVENWNTEVKNTARLISAEEINQIVLTNPNWNVNDYNTLYYLHTGVNTAYTGPAGSNTYAWLFDNTKKCIEYGCNVGINNDPYSYWTSSFASLGYAWYVRYDGRLDYGTVTDTTSRGVRPVIEVPKSIFE